MCLLTGSGSLLSMQEHYYLVITQTLKNKYVCAYMKDVIQMNYIQTVLDAAK